MRRAAALILAAALGAVFLWQGGEARAAVCNAKDILIAYLGEKFGEQRRGVGLAESVLVEVWVSDEGTFTITSTRANGLMCILAAGEYWEEVAAQKGEEL